MPGLPDPMLQTPLPREVEAWAQSFAPALIRHLRQMTYVLNGLSRTETLASRPAAPDFDHALYTADDTGEAFVGVGGAWQALNTLRLGGANGQLLASRQSTELHTLAAAATSDTTIQFPAGSLGLGVGIRVTTLITGCASLDVGITGATTRYGTGIALAAGTTAKQGSADAYTAATSVRFSAIGGGGAFTAGVVRITLYYLDITAPTS